jgi:hypothetical protein
VKAYGYWTAARIIDALRADAERRGAPPAIRHWEVATDDHPTKVTVQRAFGSWNAALAEAGLAQRVQGCDPYWSRDEISQAIYHARHKLNRLPTSKDMRRLSKAFPGQFPHPSTVAKRFGSWTEGLRTTGYKPHHNTRRRQAMQNCPRCRRPHWGFQSCATVASELIKEAA